MDLSASFDEEMSSLKKHRNYVQLSLSSATVVADSKCDKEVSTVTSIDRTGVNRSTDRKVGLKDKSTSAMSCFFSTLPPEHSMNFFVVLMITSLELLK